MRAGNSLLLVWGNKIDPVFVWVDETDLVFLRGPKMTCFCGGDGNGRGFCVDGRT